MPEIEGTSLTMRNPAMRDLVAEMIGDRLIGGSPIRIRVPVPDLFDAKSA